VDRELPHHGDVPGDVVVVAAVHLRHVPFFALLSFVFVFWRIPETKGMELEQTETLFVRKAKTAS
jgi:hypothetical protein